VSRRPGRLPGKLEATVLHFPIGLKWLQKSEMKHMFVTVNNETFVAPYSNDSSGAQLGKRPDLRRAFSKVVSVFIYQRPDPKLNPMLGPPS
jgi:hypothetical protein